MKLSILLVLVFSILGTLSHRRCSLGYRAWNLLFGNNNTPREDVDNCYCVPTYKCYQEDISTQRVCIKRFFEPDLVCCRRPVRFTTARPPPRRQTAFTHPSGVWAWTTKRPYQIPESTTQELPKISTKIPARIPPTQIRPSQPHPQDESQGFHPTHVDCTCLPQGECHDGDVKSISQQSQGSCPDSNHVCCLGLVQKETTTQAQPPKPSQIPTQSQTVGTTSRPQPPSPTHPSPPADKECICTPFFKCYDEETSSNLTNIVNDRTFIPNSCSDPNDICCYNLVKITAKPTLVKSSSGDCIGSCKLIKECPYFVNTLNQAHEGNVEAIKELRSSVCSNTDGVIRVCCPPEVKGVNNKGVDNVFGVKWPDS